MSKALATIVTQPLIVAKVGLQSKPPPARQGKPFKSFVEVMQFIVEHEGALALFKGIGPQILKGLLVQGILMMTKERYVVVTRTMLLSEEMKLTDYLQCGASLRSLYPLYPTRTVQAAQEVCRPRCCSKAGYSSDRQIVAMCDSGAAVIPSRGLLECGVGHLIFSIDKAKGTCTYKYRESQTHFCF